MNDQVDIFKSILFQYKKNLPFLIKYLNMFYLLFKLEFIGIEWENEKKVSEIPLIIKI